MGADFLLTNPNELAITAWILAGMAKRTAVFSRLLHALSCEIPAAVRIPANLLRSSLEPDNAVRSPSVPNFIHSFRHVCSVKLYCSSSLMASNCLRSLRFKGASACCLPWALALSAWPLSRSIRWGCGGDVVGGIESNTVVSWGLSRGPERDNVCLQHPRSTRLTLRVLFGAPNRE